MTKVTVNTLKLGIAVSSGKTIKIEPLPMQVTATGKYKYIILGDNRDGYDTFDNIIQQVNGKNPIFVIDNGDLVFSGKPNQYRLFDQMVSKFLLLFAPLSAIMIFVAMGVILIICCMAPHIILLI